MTRSLTKKELTHERMLDAANRSFKERGYAGIGVDGIAKAAGVTSGAFYAHFGSKDNAFRAALGTGLDEVVVALPVFQDDHGEKWVEAFADYYLGKAHRNDLACGCAMTTMTPEIARSGPKQKIIYEEKMTKIIRIITLGLNGRSQKDKETRAWSILATLTGGLNMARAMSSDNSAEKVADAVKIAASIVAGRQKDVKPQ